MQNMFGKLKSSTAMTALMSTIMAILAICLLSGCASTNSSSAINTRFDYTLEDDLLDNPNLKRILIAHVNFGKPSRNFLKPLEQRIDGFVKTRLKEAGYQIVPTAIMEDAWQIAIRQYGNPFNPTTGKINQKSYNSVLQSVFANLKQRGTVDAVLFTNLIQRNVSFGTGLTRLARWDGVSRKPSTQGPGQGVPTGFNWAQSVEAVSLWVNLFNMDLNLTFQSAGGLEVTQALSLKGSNPKFIRRKSVLGNRKNIEEGVALALHPIVKMKGYGDDK